MLLVLQREIAIGLTCLFYPASKGKVKMSMGAEYLFAESLRRTIQNLQGLQASQRNTGVLNVYTC
jgi:hypothetical protein